MSGKLSWTEQAVWWKRCDEQTQGRGMLVTICPVCWGAMTTPGLVLGLGEVRHCECDRPSDWSSREPQEVHGILGEFTVGPDGPAGVFP